MSTVKFGTGPYHTLNVKIIRRAFQGEDNFFGLFAVEKIYKGEICWEGILDENTLDMTIDEVETWPTEDKEHFHHFAYQIGPNLMRGVQDENKDYSIFWFVISSW
jgi:hypothetical protein